MLPYPAKQPLIYCEICRRHYHPNDGQASRRHAMGNCAEDLTYLQLISPSDPSPCCGPHPAAASAYQQAIPCGLPESRGAGLPSGAPSPQKSEVSGQWSVVSGRSWWLGLDLAVIAIAIGALLLALGSLFNLYALVLAAGIAFTLAPVLLAVRFGQPISQISQIRPTSQTTQNQ